MELKKTSKPINIALSASEGATPTLLLWPHGTLKGTGGNMTARWYAAQCKEDGKVKISCCLDRRGGGLTWEKRVFNLYFDLKTAGSFEYCNRLSSDTMCQIFKQSAPTPLWFFAEFDWTAGTVNKQLNLNAGTNVDIIYFSKHGKHLYYILEDVSNDWYLYYLNLNKFTNHSTIFVPTWKMQVEANKTDILAGTNYFYLYTEISGEPVIKIYD